MQRLRFGHAHVSALALALAACSSSASSATDVDAAPHHDAANADATSSSDAPRVDAPLPVDAAPSIDAPLAIDAAPIDAPPACTSGSWAVETVDATGDVGARSSIAVAPSGRLQIAYADTTNNDLKVAERADDGTWTTTTVDSAGNVGSELALAVDATGASHLVYADVTNNALKYATKPSGGAWSTATIGAVRPYRPSIRVVDGAIHVSFTDVNITTVGALRYAHKPAGSAWKTDTYATTTWGPTNALVVDGDGLVRIAHVVGNGFSTPRFNLETRDMVTNAGWTWIPEGSSLATNPNEVTLAVDSAEALHVSLTFGTNEIIYASRYAEGGWTAQRVDTFQISGNSTHAHAIDSQDGKHLVYTAPQSGGFGLRYAYKPATGVWSTASVATSAGSHPSIALAGAEPHLSFYLPSTRDLMHAYRCP